VLDLLRETDHWCDESSIRKPRQGEQWSLQSDTPNQIVNLGSVRRLSKCGSTLRLWRCGSSAEGATGICSFVKITDAPSALLVYMVGRSYPRPYGRGYSLTALRAWAANSLLVLMWISLCAMKSIWLDVSD